MSCPDIIGYTMGEARLLLDRAGIKIDRITVTSPPRNKPEGYDDSFRVIRARQIDENNIELLLCKPL